MHWCGLRFQFLILVLVALCCSCLAVNASAVLIQQQELTASDAAVTGPAYGSFGCRVAVTADGNTSIVGWPGQNNGQGAVYVFTRSGSTWSQQKLTASDGVGYNVTGNGQYQGDQFGDSVALSADGNYALIGASGKKSFYAFTRSSTTWTQQQEIAGFGDFVALSADGNTAFTGTSQNMYVFTRSGSVWSQQQVLTASDGADLGSRSVALSADGNTAVIGAYDVNSSQGAVYVFTRSGSVWSQQQKLTASDGTSADYFGSSVSLSADGNTALIGAPEKTFGQNYYQGAVYVFTRSGSVWSQQQELTASDGANADYFGDSAALSADGNTALIGKDQPSRKGSAYVFTRSGLTWSQQQELKASDGAYNGLFGYPVALSADGNTTLIGAPGINSNTGAIYVFDTVAFAVKAGGSQYADNSGVVYSADADYSGGGTYSTTALIGGTADSSLYQTLRYGDFSYRIPLANGNYNVTLKFAEIYWNAAGKRIFNVSMQGQQVISNLDIYAQVGKNTAYDVTIPVIVTNGFLTIAFKSVVDNAQVNSIMVALTQSSATPPPQGAVVFAVNAGGGKYTDASGNVYQPDMDYAGGKTYITSGAIAGTPDAALYQTGRYGNFSYTIPLVNGNYNVTLKFAEIYWNSAGMRLFNVSMQGQQVITELDVFDKAGGQNVACAFTFPATVANGILNIAFTSVLDNAMVSAIEITSGQPQSPTPAVQLSSTSLNFVTVAGTTTITNQNITVSNGGGGTLNWVATADQTTPAWLSVSPGSGTGFATLTVSVNTNGLAAGTYAKNITVSADGATNTPQTLNVTLLVNNPSNVAFAVSAGGGKYTDTAGNVYQGDTDYSGGLTYSTTATITGTSDPTLYQSQRYGNLNHSFSYSIPLANGIYNVTLKFAELFWTKSQARVFNVSMQGIQVISNLDVYSKVGTNSAYDVTIPVTVINGTLNITFTGVVDNPIVNAILVDATGQPLPPTIQLYSSGLSFSTVLGINPQNQSTTVSNGGGGTLNWVATADQTAPAWLSVSPGNGTGDGTLIVSANTNGLAAGTYAKTITVAALGATNTPQTVNVTLLVNKPGNVAYAVNAGGGKYTDTAGNVYQADTDYSGGLTIATTAAITGTSDPVLYQSQRYGDYNSNFSYNIPLANGTYNVTLKFAELYWNKPQARVFSVSMQGTRVISNLDVYSKVGMNSAYDVTIPVTVVNGTLDITFTPSIDVPFVSAIEVNVGVLPPQGVIDSPAADTTITVGDQVNFKGLGRPSTNGVPLTYLWHFGANSGIADSTAQNPGYVQFNNIGTYTVTLTVTDPKKLSDSAPPTRTITVRRAPIPQAAWKLLYVDSQETVAENGAAVNSFDGNPLTMWSTQWYPSSPPPPHEIQIDLGQMINVIGFHYLPRQDGAVNGRIGQYDFYTSIDGKSWGSPVASGTFANDATEKEVLFPATIGRYIRLQELTEANGNPWGSMAELNVLGTPVSGAFPPKAVINSPTTDVVIQKGNYVNFAGSGIDPGGNQPLTYLWHFGAGSGISDTTVENPGLIQFNNLGTFPVTLTVKNSLGISDPAPRTVNVTVQILPELLPDWYSVTASPFNLMPAPGVVVPVLTGADVTDIVSTRGVADPFLFHDDDGSWHMFLEVMAYPYSRISHATSIDGLHWTYDRIVLDDGYHSYPSVLKYNGNYYMIPESYEWDAVRIYKAAAFPYNWQYLTSIVTGKAFVDPQVFRYNGMWWMFVSDTGNATCYLYYSDDLLSGWVQHPMSPIVTNDASRARGGGRAFVINDGQVYRTVQRDDGLYGQTVRVFAVDTLTKTDYAEHEIPQSPILGPGGSGWNRDGMHHFDPWWAGDKWICSVDGLLYPTMYNGDAIGTIGIYTSQ